MTPIGDLVRALKVRRVSRVLHEHGPAIRRGRGDALRRTAVAVVAGAGDGQQRQLQGAQLMPHRLEYSLPRRAQEQRERARVMGHAGRAVVGLHERVRLVGEERLALPEPHDVLDRHRLHPGRELLVGLGPRHAEGALINAGRGPDEDQRAVGLGGAERGAQCEAPAQ